MEMPRKPSWWSRNWMWFVPVTVVGTAVVCAGCCGTFIFIAFNTIKGMQPYKDAVAAVQADPSVQALLGTPIEPSWWVGGEFSESTDSGSAEFLFSVTGPKGSGMVTANAEKSAGRWVTTELTVTPNAGGQKIEVVPASGTDPNSTPAQDSGADGEDGSP